MEFSCADGLRPITHQKNKPPEPSSSSLWIIGPRPALNRRWGSCCGLLCLLSLSSRLFFFSPFCRWCRLPTLRPFFSSSFCVGPMGIFPCPQSASLCGARSWTDRAANSFPVPLSPVTRIGAILGATLSISLRAARSSACSPMI
mgnify:CR=1 FL=1